MRAIDSEGFSGSDVITIKFPIALPYMADQTDFERVSGKFEYQGDVYRLIKQKYAKDCLTIVCVKDDGQKKIDRVLTDYVKTVADDHKSLNLKVSLLNEYLPIAVSVRASSLGWTLEIPYNSNSKTLVPEFFASIIHPPSSSC